MNFLAVVLGPVVLERDFESLGVAVKFERPRRPIVLEPVWPRFWESRSKDCLEMCSHDPFVEAARAFFAKRPLTLYVSWAFAVGVSKRTCDTNLLSDSD